MGRISGSIACACAGALCLSAAAPHADAASEPGAAVQPRLAALRPNGTETPAPSYRLEADVSMRSIPVDVRFSGARIVMFGSVSRLGPPAIETDSLDVVALIQGARSRLTVRRKGQVAGIWINTKSVDFEQAPRYYSVVSTRTLDLIASKAVLGENGIGFEQVPISTALGDSAGVKPKVLEEFRNAAIDLGIGQKHYLRQDAGITFVGKNLFRAEIDLPASIPVGELDVTFFLFRSGELVTRYDSRVALQREGFEHFVYEFARNHSFFYGIFTVALATGVGLLSSFIVGLRKR
jgi:uncharacterized protein (TIGR02186 family)